MDAAPQPRQVVDSHVLAAMAHPLRRRVLDVLQVHGPSTVTALAEATGEPVPNLSHHVKILARAELIVEAPERARDRRERWWALASPSLRWSPQDFAVDPAASVVAQAALSLNLDRHLGVLRAWYAAAEEERERWSDAAFTTDKWLHLTPAELSELSREVIDVYDRWAARKVSDDGEHREPVALFAYGVPAEP